MTRATNSVSSRRKNKRTLKRAKGFWGDRKNHICISKEAVMRALAFNYKHRKTKKREFRSLWITRISAAAKICGISYSKLIHGLSLASCIIDRKVLADMAVRDPKGFAEVAERAKAALV